jgi:branched-chain amino acid transport system ATP-binding protein
MTDSPLLAVQEIHTYYGASHILQGVTLDVRAGEVVGLLGRNGVGKTTTLQSILGLPSPKSGEILFRGQKMAGLATFAIVRTGIGWVPQGHRIFPTLTVTENIELAALKGRRGVWTASGMFDLFPRLAQRRTARGGSLSGGEQQMLAIARALVQNPDLILMDEPSEGLSPRLVEEVGAIIKRLNSAGCALLVVEQNLAFALDVAHRILVMNKGKIVFTGTTQDLANSQEVQSRYLGVQASMTLKTTAE